LGIDGQRGGERERGSDVSAGFSRYLARHRDALTFLNGEATCGTRTAPGEGDHERAPSLMLRSEARASGSLFDLSEEPGVAGTALIGAIVEVDRFGLRGSDARRKEATQAAQACRREPAGHGHRDSL
jgi:hypothetical protein